uniref:Uncharacterized protein n=1 Tax=Lotharella globosa TaxID=91324 RepID=A0A7S3YXR2_9EUKA|mmetsp:Transcript_6183/g.11337  ORF Transcript_6183/g.11337 Transcript_6183/m.11337 type:complete len:365 (+) Transcript_6183:3-1097(+)
MGPLLVRERKRLGSGALVVFLVVAAGLLDIHGVRKAAPRLTESSTGHVTELPKVISDLKRLRTKLMQAIKAIDKKKQSTAPWNLALPGIAACINVTKAKTNIHIDLGGKTADIEMENIPGPRSLIHQSFEEEHKAALRNLEKRGKAASPSFPGEEDDDDGVPLDDQTGPDSNTPKPKLPPAAKKTTEKIKKNRPRPSPKPSPPPLRSKSTLPLPSSSRAETEETSPKPDAEKKRRKPHSVKKSATENQSRRDTSPTLAPALASPKKKKKTTEKASSKMSLESSKPAESGKRKKKKKTSAKKSSSSSSSSSSLSKASEQGTNTKGEGEGESEKNSTTDRDKPLAAAAAAAGTTKKSKNKRLKIGA